MYIYVQITHTHVYYIMHMYEFLCIIGDSESPRSWNPSQWGYTCPFLESWLVYVTPSN